MTRVVSAPFRTTTVERIVADPWRLLAAGEAGPLPDFLPHWDLNVDLRLARSMLVDVAGIRTDCGLGPGYSLAVVAVWRSPGTWLRESGAVAPLDSPDLQEVILQATIPGSLLGVAVEVLTQIILVGPRTGDPLAASYPGSILWEDIAAVAVEGHASRFPIEVTDFQRAHWAPAGAAWFLSWNSADLHEPLLRGVRLFINSRHPAVVAATTGAAEVPEHRVIRSAIYFDVGRTLIRGALENEDFLSDSEQYAEGSIGRAIMRLVQTCFPGDTPNGLRSTLRERPDYFDSMLQEALRLFAL